MDATKFAKGVGMVAASIVVIAFLRPFLPASISNYLALPAQTA